MTPELASERRLNLPNALCAYRLVGSLVLVGLALADFQAAFFVLLVTLVASDWIDGKLAIWLNQRTVFGARLDSFADAAMYIAALISVWLLRWDYVAPEVWWFAAALGTYAASTAAGLWKYGRWPSYHTRGAKTSWLLVSIAMLAVFAKGSPWFLRLAMLSVTLTNLEALGMTCVLSQWRADVPSLYHAWRIERTQETSAETEEHGH